MDTLAQRSQPWVFNCAHDGCGQPIDVWDWDVASFADPGGRLDPLCLDHAIALAPPQERDVLRTSLHRTTRDVRERVGLPGGTLITVRDDIGNRNPRSSTRFPGTVYAVVVDAWPDAWPHDRITWRGPGADGRSQFVIFASFVTAGPDIDAGLLIHGSWDRPTAEFTVTVLPPNFVGTKAQERRLLDARGAFFKLRDPRGRRPGGGPFGTPNDVESAVFRTVCALIKKSKKSKKSRKSSYRPTYEDIGRAIGIDHRPAWREPLRNPDRSFTRLCERHGLKARELVSRAIASCANGE